MGSLIEGLSIGLPLLTVDCGVGSLIESLSIGLALLTVDCWWVL